MAILSRSFTLIRLAVIVLAQVAPGYCAYGREPRRGTFGSGSMQYQIATNLQDPVAVLQRQLDAGKARLKFDSVRGYLPALLDAFHLPISSQGLVFSKTSCQAEFTSPRTPRALYFNDVVSLGWVPDGTDIDVIAIDPHVGPVFYSLAQQSEKPPHFEVRAECMRCHFGGRTTFLPELVVRSFYTAPDGKPLSTAANFVSHDIPLADRWGGWYVTGTHSNELHLGNIFVPDRAHLDSVDRTRGANITDLRPYFDSARYLSSGSDIVALLVLEHQVRMQNLLTRAYDETRLAEEELSKRRLPGAIGSPDWPKERIALAAEQLLQYMLFRDEVPLRGPIKGTSGFAEEFAQIGPRTADGRSLRQFDLGTRLFRYPCSFLVYTPSFDALPNLMKEFLWLRLKQILTGQDHSAAYETFAEADRHAVFEILRETKPEFAAWLKNNPGAH